MSAAPLTSSYRPRPTNGRRTKADILALREIIYSACETHQPLTVRNLFYLLVSAGHVEKTENAYKNIVIRLAGLMREQGDLPWDWLVDSTRWMRKPRSYTGLDDLLERSTRLYRRDLWAQSDEYVEIWCESESIAGVLYPITEEYDVPLMAARGFSSKPFLFDSAATIARCDRATTIYYVGDYDPSGVVARRDVERRLSRYLEEWFTFTNTFTFVSLAVTPELIEAFDLPTKPPKTRGNTHARSLGWGNDRGTVEAEALDPDHLRSLLRGVIESHLPEGELRRLRAIEQEERRTLERLRFELDEENRG